MSPLTYVAMYGFIPLAIWLFGKYPPRTAVAAVFVIGWSFLPQAVFVFPVIPDYTKVSALGMAAMLAVYLKDPKVFRTFRPSLVDIPILCWCLSPFFSSITNGLGPWDGMSGILLQVFEWGIPYFLGRLYFGELDAMKTLGIAMFIGALVLAPLAVFEIILSPQLHIMLYGWYPHDFSQTKRGGSFRPSVFMHHGLELAIWLMAGLFLGWQMFLQKTLKGVVPLLKVPLLPSLVVFTLIFIACRSSGALMLLAFAMLAFFLCRLLRSALPFFLLLSLPLLYMTLRANGLWDAQNLVESAQKATGSAERGDSLAYRIFNETMLIERARQQPFFGWGGFGRSWVRNEEGKAISVPDGMWILTYGDKGLFGLASLAATILLMPILFAIKWPPRTWGDPLVAPSAAFAVVLGVTMIDNLFNAMYNPVIMLAAGGLASLVALPQRVRSSADLNRQDDAGGPAVAGLPATRVI